MILLDAHDVYLLIILMRAEEEGDVRSIIELWQLLVNAIVNKGCGEKS